MSTAAAENGWKLQQMATLQEELVKKDWEIEELKAANDESQEYYESELERKDSEFNAAMVQ